MHSIRLRYQDVDWPVATRAAAKVMPKGGQVEMNIWTSNKQQVDALTDAFQKAGFKVTDPGGRFSPGPGTIIKAERQ
jgi:hypothetical protein